MNLSYTHITEHLCKQVKAITMPSLSLVDALYQLRQQAEKEALHVLEHDIATSERKARQAAVRMKLRHQSTPKTHLQHDRDAIEQRGEQ